MRWKKQTMQTFLDPKLSVSIQGINDFTLEAFDLRAVGAAYLWTCNAGDCSPVQVHHPPFADCTGLGLVNKGGAANLQPTYFILKRGSVATSLCIIACVVWQKPDPFWSVDLESSDFPAGQPETFLFPALHSECSGSFSGWARKRRPIPKASHWRTRVCLGVPKNFEEEGQGPEWPPPHPMAESQGRQCPKRPGHGFERSSLDLFSSLVVPNYWVCQVRSHRLGEGRGWAIERGRLGLDFKFGGVNPFDLNIVNHWSSNGDIVLGLLIFLILFWWYWRRGKGLAKWEPLTSIKLSLADPERSARSGRSLGWKLTMMHAFTWMQMASKNCFRMGFAVSRPVLSTRTSSFWIQRPHTFFKWLKTWPPSFLKERRGNLILWKNLYRGTSLFKKHEGTPCNWI